MSRGDVEVIENNEMKMFKWYRTQTNSNIGFGFRNEDLVRKRHVNNNFMALFLLATLADSRENA